MLLAVAAAIVACGSGVKNRLVSAPEEQSRAARREAGTRIAADAGLNHGSAGSDDDEPTDMVRIPAGHFMMGWSGPVRPPDADEGETQAHLVNVATFEIDRLEVSFFDFDDCIQAHKCVEVSEVPKYKWGSCRKERLSSADLPMDCVTLPQAAAYCEWRAKRLPTEVEWEYAARGTDGRTYPWGNDERPPDKDTNYDVRDQNADAYRKPGPAGTVCTGRGEENESCTRGSHPADVSAFGVLDMGGNVEEWTSSRYTPNLLSPPVSLKKPLTKVVSADGEFVTRGGSWREGARASRRGKLKPTDADNGLGFRCAR